VTRVDFHVNVADKVGYGCRLVRKIRQQDLRAVVFCEDAVLLRQFDEALWTFEPLEFIAHVPAAHPLAARTPVLLTARDMPLPDSHYGVLVNLGHDLPPFFSRFERVLELVGSDDEDRDHGRRRWRSYKDRGYPLASHDVARQRKPS
jgi:DNA polymerase-3 subunit chi